MEESKTKDQVMDSVQEERQEKLSKVSLKSYTNEAGVKATLTKLTGINLQPDGGFLSLHVQGFMSEEHVVANKAAFDDCPSFSVNPKDPEVVAFVAYCQAKLDAKALEPK